jgi:hypothetical protein
MSDLDTNAAAGPSLPSQAAGFVRVSDAPISLPGSTTSVGTTYAVTAAFWAQSRPKQCVPSQITEQCTIIADCPNTYDYVSAGAIDVIGFPTPVTLTPDDHDYYLGPALQALASPLVTGQTLRIEATGAAVPAFSGAVLTPEPVVVIAPPPPVPSQRLHLAPTQALSVVAEGGGTLSVTFTRLYPTSVTTLECQFPGQPHQTVSIPPIAMAVLPKGEALLRVTSLQVAHVQAGSFSVALEVSREGDAQGSPAAFPVTIE